MNHSTMAAVGVLATTLVLAACGQKAEPPAPAAAPATAAAPAAAPAADPAAAAPAADAAAAPDAKKNTSQGGGDKL